METLTNAMGKRSGMSPVDDYIRELLAASPQGHVDESFEALNDPCVRQANSLQRALFRRGDQDTDRESPSFEGSRVFHYAPGRGALDLNGVIREAMRQNPVGTEEMNPVPPRLEGVLGDITQGEEDDYGPDAENANYAVESRFPASNERLKTPGWIPPEEPGVAEADISRYEDLRHGRPSETASDTRGELPFRLRGPVNLQLDEQQSLISRLLNAFR